MSTKTVTQSDISGKSGASQISFSIEAEFYEIDLIADKLESLRKTLAPYVEKARPATRASSTQPSERDVPETTHIQRYFIRKWAKENGLDLRDRGRIPKKIVLAYLNAHGGDLPQVSEEEFHTLERLKKKNQD